MKVDDELHLNCGDAVVVSYVSDSDIIIKFSKNLNYVHTTKKKIIEDNVFNPMHSRIHGVGFIGVGVFKSHGRAYSTWAHMISRCYNDNDKDFNWYKDCTVCDEWHNYQVYAEWYYSNYPKDGEKYDLDKDFKIEGNKKYSPETCIFLKPTVNRDFGRLTKGVAANHYSVDLVCITMISPAGDEITIKNINQFAKANNLDESALRKVSSGKRSRHKGWTKA